MKSHCEKGQIEAVIFDLDGVLLDSEQVWNDVRKELTIDLGGRWKEEATRAMMGMSSTEWSGYMHDDLAVPLEPEAISKRVAAGLREIYVRELPLLPGAAAAVGRLAARWPLGLASSSNRELIDLALDVARLAEKFQVTVFSEEVDAGKPSPDVYLEAARRMGVAPERCVAVEDSGNGIRAGKAAGMMVVAIPNHALPPEPEALRLAAKVLGSIEELDATVIEEIVCSC